MTPDVADVLIIGAGPSGGAAATRLMESGFSVVCLEQGEWPDRGAYRGGKYDWELTARKQWSWFPEDRGLDQDYPIELRGDEYYRILNFNGVGGSATMYNAVWPRLTPANFKTRSLYGYGDDWPISYEELLPFYERTDREVGVSGLGGNPAYPQDGDDPPLPPMPIQTGGKLLARAHNRLGWHWWPETQAILSAPYDGRNACVQRGVCNQGCPEGAKGTSDLTHWRHVVAGGGQVITGARVLRIVLDERGLACGAEWIDRNGQVHFQAADVVICAANGIGTPRLLLASACEQAPNGLANSSGLVGRNLMLHMHGMVIGLFEEQLKSWQGQFGGWVASMQFYESDEARGAVGSCKWQSGPTGGPLLQALAAPGLGVWGDTHHQHVREHLGHSVFWLACVEDLASVDNRVELSTTMSDSDGLAAPRITYQMSDNIKRLTKWHLERGVESMTEAGAWKTEVFEQLPMYAHLLGTARMGNNPSTSVLNRWGISHDVANLAVVDGSSFVTSAGVNPTTTISALAARTANYLATHRSEIPRPNQRHVVAVPDRQLDRAPSQSPSEDDKAVFTDLERTRLAELADSLIPASDGMPAPSTVGIDASLFDLVIEARPDLVAALHRALERADVEGGELLSVLASEDVEARDALELAIAGGYYLSEIVQAKLGYTGQVAIPVRADSYHDYVDEGLIDQVLENVAGRYP